MTETIETTVPITTVVKQTGNFTEYDCCEFDTITKVEKRRLYQENAALKADNARLNALVVSLTVQLQNALTGGDGKED